MYCQYTFQFAWDTLKKNTTTSKTIAIIAIGNMIRQSNPKLSRYCLKIVRARFARWLSTIPVPLPVCFGKCMYAFLIRHLHLNIESLFPNPEVKIEQRRTDGIKRHRRVRQYLMTNKTLDRISERHSTSFGIAGKNRRRNVCQERKSPSVPATPIKVRMTARKKSEDIIDIMIEMTETSPT